MSKYSIPATLLNSPENVEAIEHLLKHCLYASSMDASSMVSAISTLMPLLVTNKEFTGELLPFVVCDTSRNKELIEKLLDKILDLEDPKHWVQMKIDLVLKSALKLKIKPNKKETFLKN